MKKGFIDNLKERQRTIFIEQSGVIHIDETEQRLNRSLSKVTQDKIYQRGKNAQPKAQFRGSFNQIQDNN